MAAITREEMTPLEAAQPYWRVAEGGEAGLTEEEREALDQNVAPAGFTRSAALPLAFMGRALVAIGAVGVLGALGTGAWIAWGAVTRSTPVEGADVLFLGLAAGGLGLALGVGMLRASRLPPRPIPLHRREGRITSKRGHGLSGGSPDPIEHRVNVDDRLELRLLLGAGALYEALEEGRAYRFWYTPHPGAAIVYVEELEEG